MRILLVLVLAAGCGQNKVESKQLENQATAPVVKPAPPAPKPVTPEALVTSFRGCWDTWNAQHWKELEGCFAATAVADAPGSGGGEAKGPAAIVESLKPFHAAFPDATGKPELVMANGNRLIAIVHLLGKHDAVWKVDGRDLLPTHKQISVYLAQVLEYDDKGKITKRSDYYDPSTVIGQLRPLKKRDVRSAMDQPLMIQETVIAKDDAREKANLKAVKQFVARLDKRPAPELIADRFTWSEQPLPKDLDRKGALARMAELSVTLDGSLAAGDFVAAFETREGMLPMLAIHQVDHDKIAAVWTFYQDKRDRP